MKVLRLFQALIAALCTFHTASCSTMSIDSLGAINYVEAILGASRGPLSALSYRYQATTDSKSKVFHSLVNLVRMAHEACAIINHKDESPYSLGIRSTWITFDAINFYNNLFAQNKKADDDTIELSVHAKKMIDRLVENLQLFLLPTLESITSIYQALTHEQTEKNRTNRRQAQAFCSLARATSIFLNNRQSKAAILLLFAALSETVVAMSKSAQEPLVLNNQNRQQSPQLQQAALEEIEQSENEHHATQELQRRHQREREELARQAEAATRELQATREELARQEEQDNRRFQARREELARQTEDLNRRTAEIAARHDQALQEVMERHEANRDRTIAHQNEQTRILNEFLEKNPTAFEMENFNQLLERNAPNDELQAFVNNHGPNL